MKLLYIADIRLPTEKAHGLQIVQNWNGKSPLVVGADSGANLLMSVDQLIRHATPSTNRPAGTLPLPRSR